MGDLYGRFEKWLMQDYNYKVHTYQVKNFKVPDWRQYKVEDVPDLVRVKNALASRGLHDPWLRNEVWRFNPAFGKSSSHNLRLTLFRGWKLGAVAALTLYAFDRLFEDDDHHGHH